MCRVVDTVLIDQGDAGYTHRARAMIGCCSGWKGSLNEYELDLLRQLFPTLGPLREGAPRKSSSSGRAGGFREGR